MQLSSILTRTQVNTIPAAAHPPLGVRDYLSVSIFAASWLFEIGEWSETFLYLEETLSPTSCSSVLEVVHVAPYAYITLTFPWPSNVICADRASTVADQQKTNWRRAKERKDHDEQFITSGLWSISRHPKYVNSKTFLTF